MRRGPILTNLGNVLSHLGRLVEAIDRADRWRTGLILAQQFVDAISEHGGDAELCICRIAVHSNTHFPFSDLNSREIADLLSRYLREKGLAKRGGQGE
jgi:hypothetical protein